MSFLGNLRPATIGQFFRKRDMAGKKPSARIFAKSKTSQNYVNIAAFWDQGDWFSGKLEDDIAFIELKSGARISNENVYINLKLEAAGGQHSQAPTAVTTGKHPADATGGKHAFDPPKSPEETMRDIPF